MRKQMKGNLYNHLEKHIPLPTRTSCGFETTFKDSPYSTEWIDVRKL